MTWDLGMGGKLWKSGREESLHPEAGSGGREGRPRPEFWEDFVQAITGCHVNNCDGRLQGRVVFSSSVLCDRDRTSWRTRQEETAGPRFGGLGIGRACVMS